jgi:hypothetical protein
MYVCQNGSDLHGFFEAIPTKAPILQSLLFLRFYDNNFRNGNGNTYIFSNSNSL